MNAFDRAYARGPWRSLPAPAHLADRRTGLVFQLAWAGALAALVAALGWAFRGPSHLLDPRALSVTWAEAVPLALVAIGTAVVFARGGFDFSASAVASLAAILAARTGDAGLALAAALACGLANGLLVALLRVPGWLVTSLTALLLAALDKKLLLGLEFYRLSSPTALQWAISAMPIVAAAAGAAALAFAQVLPSGAPARSRLREGAADVLVYVFAAGLAAAAGLFRAAYAGGAGLGSGDWLPFALAVIAGGTWFGAGRANVAGAIVGAIGVAAFRVGLLAAHVPPGRRMALEQVVLVVAVGAAVAVHALAARRYARARAGVLPAPPAADRPRLFDRGLFDGPGAIVPVPVHLTDRRCALRIELGWSAVLLVAFALLLAALRTAGFVGWTSASFLGPQLVIPVLVALGASAVVARGGFDFSAGALLGLVTSLAAQRHDPWLALLVALAIGVLNGGAVALLRVPGWLATAVVGIAITLGNSLWAREAVQSWALAADLVRPVWIASGAALLAGAIVAFVWVQLLPGRGPDRPAVRWRERLGDGLPYLFSAALAGVAGVYELARLTELGRQLTPGGETLSIVILAGCWLGAGRANVVGVVIAAAGVTVAELALSSRLPDPRGVLAAVGGAALLALAASRVVHLRAAAAYARRTLPEKAGPLELAP